VSDWDWASCLLPIPSTGVDDTGTRPVYVGVTPVPPGHYRCSACSEVYPLEAGRDEQAKAEAVERHGSLAEGPMEIVCDACFWLMAAQFGWDVEPAPDTLA
jgi:hypothetical protein